MYSSHIQLRIMLKTGRRVLGQRGDRRITYVRCHSSVVSQARFQAPSTSPSPQKRSKRPSASRLSRYSAPSTASAPTPRGACTTSGCARSMTSRCTMASNAKRSTCSRARSSRSRASHRDKSMGSRSRGSRTSTRRASAIVGSGSRWG